MLANQNLTRLASFAAKVVVFCFVMIVQYTDMTICLDAIGAIQDIGPNAKKSAKEKDKKSIIARIATTAKQEFEPEFLFFVFL
jgi:hypothetical protein